MISIDAVLVDAGGVLILPDHAILCAALGDGPWNGTPELLDRAHYRAISAVDAVRPDSDRASVSIYVAAFARALDVQASRRDQMDALKKVFDAGLPSWTTVVPDSVSALRTIGAADHRIVIVSNSQGSMDRHLRTLGVCQVGEGSGPSVSAVVDSGLVGAEKPDPSIFRTALNIAASRPEHTLHVGDSVWFDVEGAIAVGVRGIHFDPFGFCPGGSHDHVGSLKDLDLGSPPASGVAESSHTGSRGAD